MLSDTDFELICKELAPNDFELGKRQLPLVESSTVSRLSMLTESELTALMVERSAKDSIGLNFLSVNRFNNFIPAIIKAAKQQVDLTQSPLSEQINGSADKVKSDIENYLATLCYMPECRVVNDDYISMLTRLLIFCQSQTTNTKKSTNSKVLIPATVSPAIRNALRCRVKYHSIDLVVLDYDKSSGCLSLDQLKQYDTEEVLAVVLSWPNYFGFLEDLSELSNWAKIRGSRVIALSDPLSLSLLKSPYSITDGKVDYILGDCQACGLSPSQSGQSPSFLASSQVLEDELRSSFNTNFTSNNVSVIHRTLSLSGVTGLYQSARQSNELLNRLVDKLTAIDGVTKKFSNTSVNECVIEIAQIDLQKALKILAGHNMVFGHPLQNDFPELSNCLLIYCSNQHSLADIEKLVQKVATVVKNLSTAGCPVKPKF